MDIVYLSQLKAETIIGVLAWERSIRQTIVVDMELGTNTKPPATSDNIQDALDYSAVGERVTKLIEMSEFKLIETLAEAIATLLLNEFNLPWVKINLNKPGAVKNAKTVGLIIERSAPKN